jgi:hypothetical protein
MAAAMAGRVDEVSAPEDLPVVAEARPVERPDPPGALAPVAVQAAALAAGGFVAGAGIAAIVRTRGRRKATRRWGKARKRLPIVASRSFLVDVHVLDPRK